VSAPLLLGVDAGGSHTTALVADGAGRPLGSAHGEPGAVRPGHEQAAADAILDTCRQVLRHLPAGARAGVLVVGAAGAGADAPREALRAALLVGGLAPTVLVTTDAEIALVAAFGAEPGIVLLAGTGSIAWARLPDGAMARIGGLGPTLGDQGSGFDIGRQGLRAAALARQGLGDATLLAAQILPDDAALASAVLSQHETPPRLVAMLARLVIEAADGGDAVARRIVESGADQLFAHVAALARRFPPGSRVKVALGGGLLSSSQSYRNRVVERLAAQPHLVVDTTPIEPAKGAIEIARGAAGAG